MPEFVQVVLEFLKVHQAWAPPIVFFLAFAESLAIVSLIFPATIILWGVGALIGAASLDFWPIWFAAAIGAALGDWVSYWLGYHFHDQIARMWPIRNYPTLLPRGHAFFEKWGALGVFGGRFIGPLRAAVPLAAGACEMPRVPFHIANWSSAFVWATTTLAPGVLGAEWLTQKLGWGP
ncbi:MAG: DedA family protein [Beijerinckiaceae bacterium]|nr:DedA family protein [Beijerinckiaceae bacterium]